MPALGNSGRLNKLEIELGKVNKEFNYPQATLRKLQCFLFQSLAKHFRPQGLTLQGLSLKFFYEREREWCL